MSNSSIPNIETKLPRATTVSKDTGLRAWELAEGLVIRERRNDSGSVSFRLDVPAKVMGARQRIQFADFHEASCKAEKVLADKKQFGLSGFQLSKAQTDDAAKALLILMPFEVTLARVAEYYAKHEKPQKGDVTLNKLVEAFLADKRLGIASKVGVLRERSISELESRLGMFTRTHGESLAKVIREDTIKAWLFADSELSAATRRNNHRCLRNLFNYAVENGYVAENPVLKVRVPKPEEKPPQILTLTQCASLLAAAHAHAELDLLPYVALGMFCGVRSEELAKLDWKHVNMKTGLVTIPSEIAKKRRIRNFIMPECCKAWLIANGVKFEGAIRPEGFNKRFRKLVKAAEIAEWPHNGLRHSAASYHFGLHNNSALTCSMLGQRGDDVLFTHYRSLVAPDDAQQFYKLFPGAEENVLRMAS